MKRFCERETATLVFRALSLTCLIVAGCAQGPGGGQEVATVSRPLTTSYVMSTPGGMFYTDITGTTVWRGSTDTFDDEYRDIPIGFTFDFFDRSYSTVRVSTNGVLTFGDTGTSAWAANAAIPGAAVPHAFVAPWWDDLVIGPYSGTPDEVSFATLDAPPNRVFVVQFKSVTTAGSDPGNVNFLNFQVKLREAGNVIELWYGSHGGYQGMPPPGSASAGIEDRSGMNGYTALACTPICVTQEVGTDNFPPEDTVIRFTPSTDPSVARAGHTATLMTDGTVLATGGAQSKTAEIYSVRSPGWSLTGDMTTARSDHTATVLLNGDAFVAGGSDGVNTLKSSEIYSRSGRSFKAGPLLNEARQGHTATLLQDGRVFIAGGVHGGTSYLTTAEIADAAAGTITPVAGEMPNARAYHTATLLTDGKVFIAGGYDGTNSLDTAVVFDPKTGTFTPVLNKMSKGRRSHTATLMADGLTVLVAGGRDNAGALTSTESYLGGVWMTRGSLIGARFLHTATLLLDGTVLVTGGLNGNTPLGTTEVFSTNTGMGTWTPSASLLEARYQHTATMLPSARILIYGGIGLSGSALKTAEVLANVGSSVSSLLRPSIVTSPVTAVPGDTIKITGLGLRGITEGSSGGTQSSPADVPNATLTPPAGPGAATYLVVHDFSSISAMADVPCATLFGNNQLRVITDGVASEARALTVDGVTQGTPCVCDEACAQHPPNTVCYENRGSCSTGTCAYTPKRTGTICNDNEICTSADQCDGAGTCAGTPYTCTPNQCQTSSTCDGTGGCTVVNKGFGSPCNDADACTSADQCDGSGHCIGNPMVCTTPPSPVCINGNTSRVYNQQGTCSGGTCNYTYNVIDCRPGTCSGGICTSGDPCQNINCDTPPNDQCYTVPGTCFGGSCTYPQMGQGSACNDGKPCTIDEKCDVAGNCTGLPAPVGSQCDDGNLCTRNDRCDQNGVCGGMGYTCPLPTECQQSVTCDGIGGCSAVDKPDTAPCAADTYACTADRCDGFGSCIHPVNPGFCLIGGSCVSAGTRQPGQQCRGCDPAMDPYDWSNLDASTVCNDSAACTSNDHCNGAGACAGTAYNCPAPNQCQQGVACDGSGGCNVVYESSSAPCDDGNACSSGDHCDGAGNCAGTPYSCAPGQCEATSTCNGTGGCTATFRVQGTQCDDADDCTSNDRCDGQGNCGGTPFTCPAPNECQESVTCDGAGACDTVDQTQGEPCTADGLDCTTDVCDGVGACGHGLSAGRCLIGGVCYADGQPDPLNSCRVCDVAVSTGVWTLKNAGEPCDDEDFCTRDDECRAGGVCAGTAYTCPVPTECQEPVVCDGLGGCVATDKPDGTSCTPDSDPCTADECQAGECVHSDLPRGAPCDDGDPCTENDKCDSQGMCSGTLVPSCQPDGGTPDGSTDGGGDAATKDGGKLDGGAADGGKDDAGKPADGGKTGDGGAVGDGSLEKPDTGGVPGENSDLSAVGGGCSCAMVGF
ncbi:MAG: hypothetical protein HY897_26050 [Deltaproteobacteria bacterium]|nr:hypothetical protein [Deltaproteobacteria bacterium]